MPPETEPITSLLIRETTIAAAAAGKLSRALWQISRVLRKHLQPDVDCAKDGYQQGKSGAEAGGRSGTPAVVDSVSKPDDPFQKDLWTSHD